MYVNGKNISFTDRSVRSVDLFLRYVNSTTPLTTEQEYNLWALMRQGDSRARNQLIEANLRFAVSVAKRFLPSGASFEDLIQAGCEGLVRAVDKFDASLGYRFISFATWFVKNEVSKAAYDYIEHHVESLDAPISDDDDKTYVDYLRCSPCQSTDWNLRYRDALETLKRQAEERQYGLGKLTAELHQMLIDGYTTADFAKRHHLNEQKMLHILSILREEATSSLPTAA
jgi:RNA polymerase sigma factor (sigma-70 family)